MSLGANCHRRDPAYPGANCRRQGRVDPECHAWEAVVVEEEEEESRHAVGKLDRK